MPPTPSGDEEPGRSHQNSRKAPEEPPSPSGACTTCKKTCATRCSHCKKAFYCSVDCQQAHRKTHRRDCFPAELITPGGAAGGDAGAPGGAISESYPHWIATRDIKEGELIFSEQALFVGPDDHIPKEYAKRDVKMITVCLGCTRILEEIPGRKCSKCSWIVCSEACEKGFPHADFECVVFSSKGFGPTQNMEQYNMVSIMRCLLLKGASPQKWTQLMNLVPAPDKRADHRSAEERKMEQFEEQCQIEFFSDILGIPGVSAAEIDHVTKVWNTLKVQPLPTIATHCQGVLFYYFKFISHSCLPNTKSLDDGNTSKLNTYATTKIPAGSKITNSIVYGNCMDGTKARRRALRLVNGFDCKCERCADPTELGTFMSAIKCPGEAGGGHPDAEVTKNVGYLLPRDPLDDNSDWQCNSPKCTLRFTDVQISKMLEPVWNEVSTFVRRSDERRFEVLFRDDVGEEDYVLICDMENYLDKMGKVLHPNHYFIFALMKKILIGMSSCISPVELNPEAVTFSFRSHRFEIAERMQQLASHCVKLSKVILPGVSLFTGRMLYFLATSKWILVVEHVAQGGSIDRAMEEYSHASELNGRVKTIFKGCPPGSPEIVLQECLQTWETVADELFRANPAFAARMP